MDCLNFYTQKEIRQEKPNICVRLDIVSAGELWPLTLLQKEPSCVSSVHRFWASLLVIPAFQDGNLCQAPQAALILLLFACSRWAPLLSVCWFTAPFGNTPVTALQALAFLCQIRSRERHHFKRGQPATSYLRFPTYRRWLEQLWLPFPSFTEVSFSVAEMAGPVASVKLGEASTPSYRQVIPIKPMPADKFFAIFPLASIALQLERTRRLVATCSP